MEITEAMREKVKTAALKFAKEMQDNGFTEYEAFLTALRLKEIVDKLRDESLHVKKFAENLSLEEI